jgi:hypothetical protein
MVEINIIFDQNMITMRSNVKCEFRLNRFHRQIEISDNHIIVEFIYSPFDTKDLNKPIIYKNFFCGKGADLFPLPSFPNTTYPNYQKFKITYEQVDNLDRIICSGIGGLTKLVTEEGILALPFRRYYCRPQHTTEWKNVIICHMDDRQDSNQYKILQSIDLFNSIVKKIANFIKNCNLFFDLDCGQTVYTVNILTKSGTRIGGGVGGLEGCWIYYDPDDIHAVRLIKKQIIYHELFHIWNPNFGVDSKSYEVMWFREGFCEYYYRIIRMKTGKRMKKTIERYKRLYRSHPCYGMKLMRWVELTEHNPNDGGVNSNMMYPYYQGFVYANYLHDLGDYMVMRYKQLIKTFKQSNTVRMTNEQIGEYFDKESFERYIVNGESID